MTDEGNAMTSNDLLQIIGLSPTATSKEIDAAYNTKKRELSERIVNAPTEALRNKYQSSLDELESLYREIHQNQSIAKPSGLSATMMADLPQAQPFYTEDGGVGPEVTTSSQLGIISGDILMDRYEVRRLLGAGGMGAVYAAYDQNTEREIAVKVLLPNLFSNERAQERFMNEAKLSQQLSHPSIINVFDVQRDESKGVYFLTMELLEGQTLRHAMDVRRETGKQFSAEEVVEIAAQLCDALSYAHKYTVHRDLKPENVFMTESGEIKLMDFGIARVMETSQLTKTGTSMGTAYYMSPEQLRGAGEVDGRSDQYSLSVILYELLSGEVPIGMIKPLTAQRPDVNKGLSFAISKGLSSSPSDRYETVAEYLSGLRKKGGQISLPSGKLLAVIGVFSLLLVLGATYPGWGPMVMGLFEDPELAAKVESAHKTLKVQQKATKSNSELLGVSVPAEAVEAERLVGEGVQYVAEKARVDALAAYQQATTLYEQVVQDQERQLYSKALETQGRVLALKDQLEGQRQELEDRVDDGFRLIDKYERQEKSEELVVAQMELRLSRELQKMSAQVIFESSDLIAINGKLKVAESLIRDKRYGGALASLKDVEGTYHLYLQMITVIEEALTARSKALHSQSELYALLAYETGQSEVVDRVNLVFNEAEAALKAQEWDDAKTHYAQALNHYDIEITKEQERLKKIEEEKRIAKEGERKRKQEEERKRKLEEDRKIAKENERKRKLEEEKRIVAEKEREKKLEEQKEQDRLRKILAGTWVFEQEATEQSGVEIPAFKYTFIFQENGEGKEIFNFPGGWEEREFNWLHKNPRLSIGRNTINIKYYSYKRRNDLIGKITGKSNKVQMVDRYMFIHEDNKTLDMGTAGGSVADGCRKVN